MQKKTFTILPYGPCDKWIEVSGPDLNIRVDYDDVNHKKVVKHVKHMVELLNEQWDPQ